MTTARVARHGDSHPTPFDSLLASKTDPRLLPGSCPTPFNWARYTEEEEEEEEEELPVHIFVQHVASSGPSTQSPVGRLCKNTQSA